MVDESRLIDGISLIRVVDGLPPAIGGSITHPIELSRKMNSLLKKQLIIAPSKNIKDGDFENSFEVPIAKVYYPENLERFKQLKLPVAPFKIWIYSKSVSKKIEENSKDFDIVYVHGTLLGAMIGWHLKKSNVRIPLVILQHSSNPFKISIRSALMERLAPFFFKFSKPNFLLIVDDGGELEETLTLYKKHGILHEVVYHAIDTDFFSPCGDRKKNDIFTILSTQRLDSFKRVDLGILAFKKFLEELNHYGNPKGQRTAKFIIIGDGKQRAGLEELVEKENINHLVEFKGRKTTKEVRDYLRIADVVVGTSLKSNLNLSIQEAMSCGRAVVAFDAGRTRSLIRCNYNGILVPPNDIDGFAKALLQLYQNEALRDELGRNARKTIIDSRNWDSRIKIEMQLLERIVRNKS
ncbi:MAG: glycosyltransferase family 4 protein [Methanomassiliicoccales archaeon]|jgi:glycosyltransferase involved in cell wall biosynthesis|nr:glycosyltransferase family 4 protein [Methanomassiliicoccales archaeon]